MDEAQLKQDTDLPVFTLSGQERTQIIQQWMKTGVSKVTNFSWEELTNKPVPGMTVVYMESNLEEDHRVGKIIDDEELVDVSDVVTVQFHRFQDSMFEFNGAAITCSLAFLKPIELYDLHYGRRYSYFGPPPRRNRFHGQTVATKLSVLDTKSSESPFEFIQVGGIFCASHQAGMFLGVIRSFHSDNSDWKVLAIALDTMGQTGLNHIRQLANSPSETSRRLSATPISDFINLAAPAEFTLTPYSMEPDPSVCDLFITAYKILDQKLLQDPSWRPPSYSRVHREVVAKQSSKRSFQGSSSSASTAPARSRPLPPAASVRSKTTKQKLKPKQPAILLSGSDSDKPAEPEKPSRSSSGPASQPKASQPKASQSKASQPKAAQPGKPRGTELQQVEVRHNPKLHTPDLFDPLTWLLLYNSMIPASTDNRQ